MGQNSVPNGAISLGSLKSSLAMSAQVLWRSCSRVPMSLRFTPGDENRREVVFDCAAEPREFFPSHGLGALYQGTTLVGPHKAQQYPGFSP
jgi:hypothetical protein